MAGIEAAVHFMRESFQSGGTETEAVLLVDASNAFNSINRDATLHNIRHVCPSLSTVLIKIYRNATELFVDGSTLFSEEGTTQGDPLAMPMYAMATIPLINQLGTITDLKQVWYADDATAAGSLHSTRRWWNHLGSVGPAFWLPFQCVQDLASDEGRASGSSQDPFSGHTSQYHHQWPPSPRSCPRLQGFHRSVCLRQGPALDSRATHSK